jgi:hypothetical protein
MEDELLKIYDKMYEEMDSADKRKLTIMSKIFREYSSESLGKILAGLFMNPSNFKQVEFSMPWQPKELFEKEGTQVIGWVSTKKGFQDTTAMLLYYGGKWCWGDDEESPVKCPELLEGVIPWPGPPVKFSNKE